MIYLIAVAGGMLPVPAKSNGVLINFQGPHGYFLANKYIGIGAIAPIKKNHKLA